MLDHIRKRQEEINNSIRKSFMGDGGAGAAGTGQNGFEYSESKDKDVEKAGMKKTMDEWKEGDLKSGSGAKVTEQKQAEAIGLSEEEKKKKEKKKSDGADGEEEEDDVEKGLENEGGVVAGTEEWDKTKDKTGLKKIDLVKGEDQIALLSSGFAQEVQRQRILGLYGKTDTYIQKGGAAKKGEGSRGGSVIGHTSSGKAIYERANNVEHKNFTKEDHQEASSKHLVHLAEHHGHSLDTAKTDKERSLHSSLKDYHKEQMHEHDKLALKAKDVPVLDHTTKAAKLTDDELTSHYQVEMPSGAHNRSPYFKALHQELLKREKDPKSKFFVDPKKFE